MSIKIRWTVQLWQFHQLVSAQLLQLHNRCMLVERSHHVYSTKTKCHLSHLTVADLLSISDCPHQTHAGTGSADIQTALLVVPTTHGLWWVLTRHADMPLQESQHNSVDMRSAVVQCHVTWPSLTACRHSHSANTAS